MQFLSKNALLRNKITLILCCCLALASCEDPNELGVGLVDDSIAGKYIDTLTVDVSTVYLDSIVTSGTGNILVGQYTAPYSGTLESSSFFPVSIGGAWTVAEDAAYDSLELIMPLGGYYYGDTTQAQTYEVYRVTEDLKVSPLSPYYFNELPTSAFYANNVLYNVSQTAASEPLTSFTFRPRPVSKDTISISLPDELGQEFLSLKKAGDSRLTDATAFVDYFKGLKVGSTSGSAVLGYLASGTKVRLYYSETANGAKVAKTKDFTIVTGGLQYNQIVTNLEGTVLEDVLQSGGAVPAAQTGGVSVTQAGAGLMIKLDFPHLDNLKSQLSPELINTAVLVIEPMSGTTQYPYPVPRTLGLYSTNQSNVPLRAIPQNIFDVTATAADLTATYQEANNRYEFNLTPYIIQQLQQSSSTGNALFLAPTRTDYTQGVSRLVVDGQQGVRLKIYYTTTN